MADVGVPLPPRGSTRTVGIIGWPVQESLSPLIHNAAFAALGMDWAYIPLPVAPGDLEAALAGLPAMGFAGANVTMPHKTDAARLVRDLSEDAERLRAVNTLVVGPGGLAGHNRNALEIAAQLVRDAGFEPEGTSALILGAGGAARACALALARGGAGALTVAARGPDRAGPLRSMLEGFASKVRMIPFEEAREVDADLVVNATPLGATTETLPHPPFRPGVLVIDLLYRPNVTPLQQAARAAGAVAFGGLGLLLHQAALSFELWTGQAPPIPLMSAAALSALAETKPTG